MAISNMQQARQLRAGGGIMALREPRQGYFLGKAVKKIGRGLKKVIKSPLGKAALIGGAAYGLGGARFLGGDGILKGGQGLKRFGNVLNLFRASGKGGAAEGKRGALAGLFYDDKGKFSAGRAALTGLGTLAFAAPYFQKPEEEVEEESFSITPGSIADIRYQARMRDPSLAFMPQARYVQPNFYLAKGGMVNLANGGGAGEQQMLQMLQAEYAKYRQQGGTMPFKQFAQMIMQQQPTQMAANGGRIGFLNGGLSTYEIISLKNLGYDTKGGTVLKPFGGVKVLKDILRVNNMAEGGRIGYANAGPVVDQEVVNEDIQEVVSNPNPMAELNMLAIEIFNKPYNQLNDREQEALQMFISKNPEKEIIDTDETMVEDRVQVADGGMMDYMSSANPMAKSYIMEDTDIVNMYRPSDSRQMAAEGGIMDLGGMEKDYRAEGGFVPIGAKEKADDVPARLSKNEFVFTADAVRNAGGGDIDEGAAVMERLMNNLEQGGKVSEESQGNPAQEMFDTAQQLESRIG